MNPHFLREEKKLFRRIFQILSILNFGKTLKALELRSGLCKFRITFSQEITLYFFTSIFILKLFTKFVYYEQLIPPPP